MTHECQREKTAANKKTAQLTVVHQIEKELLIVIAEDESILERSL